MIPSDASFPELPASYDAALRSCVADLFVRYEVLAIVASGTIIRGNPDRHSDLDMNVLHRGDFRERDQRFYHGVPCEIFVNPLSRIPGYFSDDARRRRPTSAHMFATGFVIFDPGGIVEPLAAEARNLLSHPPAVVEADLTAMRYGAATQFEDAEDLILRDPDGAALLLADAVYSLVRCRLAGEGGWLPRGKDQFARLLEIDPASAGMARRALWAGSSQERFEAARELCRHVTGATGFFEWTSLREQV